MFYDFFSTEISFSCICVCIYVSPWPSPPPTATNSSGLYGGGDTDLTLAVWTTSRWGKLPVLEFFGPDSVMLSTYSWLCTQGQHLPALLSFPALYYFIVIILCKLVIMMMIVIILMIIVVGLCLVLGT